MTKTLRRFFLYSWLSYRGLFTWLNPWGYISSRVVLPIMVALLFGSLGRFLGTGAARPVVGATMLSVGIAMLFGVNLAVANERTFGTLGNWILAPQSLLTGLIGKSVIHLLDAFVGATLTLTTASLVFSLDIPLSTAPDLLACAACAALSSAGLGLAASAVAVRYRDVFTAANIADSFLLVGSGAVVAPSALPAHIGVISAVLPLSHAIRAAHAVAAGAPLPVAQLGWELLVGGTWGIAGYIFLRWMVTRARMAGAYDLI